MKYILSLALCAGFIYGQILPAEAPVRIKARKPKTNGQLFIERITKLITKTNKKSPKQSAEISAEILEMYIQPHLINYHIAQSEYRKAHGLAPMNGQELVHSFFPNPLNTTLKTEVVQLFILYIAYLLRTAEYPNEIVSSEYAKTIENYILHYKLFEWIKITLEPCVPGLLNFIMPSQSPLNPDATSNSAALLLVIDHGEDPVSDAAADAEVASYLAH